MSTEIEATNLDAATTGTEILPVDGGTDAGTEQALRFRPIDGGFEPIPLDPSVPIFPVFDLRPVISSVQPAQIPVGFTAAVIVNGSNLPVNPANYTVINSQGLPAGIPVTNATGTSSRVTLTLVVSQTTPPGTYRIRVQSNGFASEGLLQIVMALGPRLDSVQPSRIGTGTSTVVATGVNLPNNAGNYSVVGQNGLPVPGVQVLAASGSSTQVTLQISVASTTLSGSYFLRASITGAAAQIPLQIEAVNPGPVLTSVQPGQIRAGITSGVVVTGKNLPVNAASYRVINAAGFNAPGVQVLSAFGSSTQVTLQIAVSSTTPAGNYRIRVESAGSVSEIPLEILAAGDGEIVIFSANPNQLAAGATTRVTLTGSNLPREFTSYTVQGPAGPIAATIVLVFAASNGSSVTLDIAIPGSTPLGFYRIRAQSGPFGAEVPVQIVMSAGLRITSVQPSILRAGTISNVVVTGSGLPVGPPTAYSVVDASGLPAAGVQVVAAFGTPTRVTLQISISAFTPPGLYRLRVTSQGQAAEFPISIQGRIVFSPDGGFLVEEGIQ